MSDLKLRVTLERGAEQANAGDPNIQAELNGVLRDLRGSGAEVSPVVFTTDAIDSGSGALVGQFVLAVGPHLVNGVSAVLVAWLTARAGRRVNLSVGNTSVSANSVEEVERLLAIAAKLDKNSSLENPFKE